MGSAPSERRADVRLAAFKILVAGGFGAGKTTLVGAISEIRPLHTEETLTQASVGVRRPDRRRRQDHDHRRDGLRPDHASADTWSCTSSARPGQDRFWFMWDELAYGALGAVVLADTRRLDDCFPSVDYFENRGLPFIVAVNCFDGAPRYDPEDVRDRARPRPDVPACSATPGSRPRSSKS